MAQLLKQKHLWKTWILPLLLIVVAYAFTRLVNLTILPIFTDEAIYIRWSQIGSYDAAWRFISLTDGKQPLFTWLTMITLRIFSDPLVAGRIVSVMAGLVTMFGLFLLSYELFKSRRITLITLALYVITPFALIYDRMALYDSLSTALSVLACYLAVKLVRTLRFDVALLLGFVLGLGMINKSSGFLSLYMLPFSLLLFPWGDKKQRSLFLKWVFYAGIAFILSQIMYGILRLSPYFYIISQKDSVFVYPISQFMYTWKFFRGNLTGLLDWLIHYLTIPIVLTMIPAFFINRKFWKEQLFIIFWCFLPLLALAYFGKVLYPRYILFMVIPLLMFAATTIDWIITRWKYQVRVIVLIGVIIFPSLYTNYYILFNPTYAPIPFADKGQFVDDWPSGWGVSEVTAFLNEQVKNGDIAVFTDGTFGLLPHALEIQFWDNPRILIKGLYPLTKEFPEEIAEQAKIKPTFLVLNRERSVSPNWPLEKIATYQKGTNTTVTMQLFKVLPIDTNHTDSPTLEALEQ